jgi:hypothetical protein
MSSLHTAGLESTLSVCDSTHYGCIYSSNLMPNSGHCRYGSTWLGAHLEAYIETLPTIIALRLCGRFGTGPQCHINKLPVELIGAIEAFVVGPARVEALETWSSEFKCFELKCDMLDDHFPHQKQHEIFHNESLGVCFGGCPFDRKLGPELAAEHREALLEYIDKDGCWQEPHDNKITEWIEKVDEQNSMDISFFEEHQEFVRDLFGINVWITNVRLPPLSDAVPKVESWKLSEAHDTTLAYMTLPDDSFLREDWASVAMDNDGCQSGFAVPTKLGAVPTEASLRRFPRAMKLLGLEVFCHPSQIMSTPTDFGDVQYESTFNVVHGPAVEWPQLTLLAKCRIQDS